MRRLPHLEHMAVSYQGFIRIEHLYRRRTGGRVVVSSATSRFRENHHDVTAARCDDADVPPWSSHKVWSLQEHLMFALICRLSL